MQNQNPLKQITLQRSLPFGHCNPAGILYTPRALDYCLEAIDALWKTILEGWGWYEMNVDLDRGTPFVTSTLISEALSPQGTRLKFVYHSKNLGQAVSPLM